MNWVIIVIAVVLLFQKPAIGILLIIGYWIYSLIKKSANPIPQNNEQHNPMQTDDSFALSAGDLADLVLLRLELQNLLNTGLIDSEKHADLNQRIDALCTRYLTNLNALPDSPRWQKHRDTAWDLLNQDADTPLGLPPWRTASLQPFSSPPEVIESEIPIAISQAQTAHFAIDITDAPEISITSPVLSNHVVANEATIDVAIPEVAIPTLSLANDLNTSPANFATDLSDDVTPAATFAIDVEPSRVGIAQPSTLNQYAWKPHEPSRLERALSTLSGWHSMAVPFLVQNIGWFIGVFCFIAGSMFLVSYTSGYTKNLIAFFAFFIFTLSLLFGGYQLRHKRPELETSSYVIFILSLLLIPLTTITATQLLLSSDSLGLRLISGLLVLLAFWVFYFAVTLVSGLMDRSLQQGLPKFFLAQTATQLLQVLLINLPFWQLLAVIHLLIFTLLSVGIYRFASQWLQSIFIDQHKIAYFAAGTLIYAAVVSFVFIAAGNRIILPDGYYGFFLMLLSGLLFFIDAQLKQWIEKHAVLSRFSFLVYGLSVLALCLVAQYQTACLLTLVLAIMLYAFVVWRYLTLTPLTILLACYFWLYSLLVLQYLSDTWYLLASLPVLFSLYYAADWALNKRQSAYLAVIVYRVLYSLLAILTIWSLSQSDAGLSAMMTAITAGILIYYALKATPIVIFTPYSKIDPVDLTHHQNLLNSHWFYLIPVLGVVTVFYAPRFMILGEAQFSLGLLLLSSAWAYQGVATFFKTNGRGNVTPIEQYLNSALLSLFVSVLPLWRLSDDLQRVIPLFLAGIILLWLSYRLLARWLFYLALVAYALAFMPVKAVYFPTPSGLATMLMGVSIWFWLWYSEQHATSSLIILRREHSGQQISLLPSCRLLGGYQLPSAATLFRDVINTPLEQVMCLFWLLGMKTLFSRLIDQQFSYAWLLAIFLAGLFALLLIVRYRLIKLLPVPILVLLGAVLMTLQFWQLDIDSLLLASVLFAIVVWQSVVYGMARPLFIKLVDIFNPALVNEVESIRQITHHTAFFIVLMGVIMQWLNAADSHSVTVLLTWLMTVGFFWLSDRAYEQLIVRYWVLGFLVLAGIEFVSLTLHPVTWQTLSTDSYAPLLLTLLSLAVGVLSMSNNTYTKPAATTAISLVLVGIFLQVLQMIQVTITPLDYAVLFLAGVSLLLANAKFKWSLCSLSAFAVWVLAVLCLENSVFHAQQAFSLWLGTQTFADLWLVLALLSLAMSLISHGLKFTQKVELHYLPPLNTIATLSFTWALLGTLTLFFASAAQADFLTGSLLVLLLALFSLSKNRSGAIQIRGLASACLPTLMVFSLLPAGLDGFSLQVVTVITGYALWLFASFILPSLNKRYQDWTIAPLFFPYLGFLLVAFSCAWWQAFDEFSAGIYGLELFIYCLLMLRYSRWQGFAWLASFAVTGAVLWLENSIVHTQPLSLLLGQQTFVDLWLVLGLLSLSMSLSHRLKSTQKWAEVYCVPLNTVATLCFIWSLLGTLTLFFVSAGQANLLACLLLVLLLAAFSLSKDAAHAARSRGFASACLLTLTAFSLLPMGLDNVALQTATVLFGYALWCCANFILPRFNQRYRDWEISPNFFPWLGLVLLGCAWWQVANNFEAGIYCLELSLYSLLMLRYSTWLGFSWLCALAFSAAGVILNVNTESLPINLLLWANLQLLLMNVWQGKGEKLAERWQWQQTKLAPAFKFITGLIFIAYLLIASLILGADFIDANTIQDRILEDILLVGMVLNLSFLHLLWLRFSVVTLHGFIYALLLLLWTTYLSYLSTLFHPPLFLALWSVLLLLGHRNAYPTRYQNDIIVTLSYWLRLSVILATLALLTYSLVNTLGELLLSLLIVMSLSAILGWRSSRSIWLVVASIEWLLFLHGWPFLLVDYALHTLLLPWYALQTILFASLSTWLLTRLSADTEYTELCTDGLRYASWLIALSLLELGAHGLLIRHWVLTDAPLQWLLPPFDMLAALSTGLIISIIGLRHVRHLPDSKWLYGIVMLIGGLAFYGRLLWLGAAAVSLWDTAALIGFAYSLFFLQGLLPSKPLYNTALLMPVLALFTVPMQLASPETSVTLMATGLLYALVRRHTQQKIPLYLALLAFNAGVYLWVPSLVDSSRLIQIYVIPAALSSLMLLHLHSRELKPSVLMGSRLAAISSIYACATVDVFLRAELGIFILAMVLSVAGILLGIALRTRAFLYAGISFLLLNVIGQLLRFYPEQMLGKAIVLMSMGFIILGLMFWFNIKRVAILQRLNAIQAEMRTWE